MSKQTANIRFLLILLVLLLVSGAAFYSISLHHNDSSIKAENGVLDFTGTDFTDTLYRLDGEWEFYFGQLYTPEDFASGEPSGKTLIPLPNGWKAQGYPVEGVTTYRLRILSDEPELTMLMPEIMTASVLYINGEKALEAGTVGRSASDYTMGLRNAFLPVRFENGGAEIIIQASNYDWRQGGLTKPFQIGLAENIMSDGLTRRILLAAFIGAVLMIGVYHFILFLSRRNDRVYLLFALFCLATAVQFIFEINALGTLLLPDGVGAFSHRVYMAMMVLQVALLLLFTHTIFGLTYGGKERRRRRVIPLLGAVGLITAAVVIVIQDKLSIGYSVLCLAAAVMLFGLFAGGKARRVFYFAPLGIAFIHAVFVPFTVVEGQWVGISVLPLAMTFVAAIREKTYRRNLYNILYLLSLLVFILWEPITKIILLDHNFVSGVTSHLFLILSQCIMLAVSYAETKRQAEALTAKTDFYRRMSHDLRTPLTVVSTNIQTARRRPEEADVLLEKSQDEIMKMAKMINDVLDDGSGVI